MEETVKKQAGDSPNLDFARQWFNAICGRAASKRHVTISSKHPFKESFSFANRKLKIGNQIFAGGLAMLADGSAEIRSTIPIVRFRSVAGVDDSPETRRMLATPVIFSIEINGRAVWKSAPLMPGKSGQTVDIAFAGTKRLVLKAQSAGKRGRIPPRKRMHADYADAVVELENGTICNVARTIEEQRLQNASRPLFSFCIDGLDSSEFFKNCARESTTTELKDGGRVCTVRYTNKSSGLECRLEALQFNDFPSVEWIIHFTNISDKKSPLIENIRALDTAWPSPAPARLHCARGSNERLDDFQHVIEELSDIRSDMRSVRLNSSDTGHSSVNWLPFMNMETAGDGMVVAIGWSGQWSAEIGREPDTGYMRMRAGMDGIRLRLHPGESIRTPRILLLHWQGNDPCDGNNLLRRYIQSYCLPRYKGSPLEGPVCLATWGGQPTEKHLKSIKQLKKHNLKYDCYWVDAGWYGMSSLPCPDVFNGEWWKLGDWRVNLHYHKDGLKPIGDAAHRAGMKFLLWFELERAMHGAPITLKHPEWFLSTGSGPRKNGDNLLLNLGNPEAFAYAVETVSGIIETSGVDWYRQDFNLPNPAEYWKANDQQERQGITQIRHIEGLYAFWDKLRLRFPKLLIDNCASGGRRIDLETISRSIPLWRSDYGCFAEAEPEGLQVHAAGLTFWVPVNAGGSTCPPGDSYHFRSNLSAALVESGLCNDVSRMDDLISGAGAFPLRWHRKMLKDYHRVRPLFSGDFYPLTSMTTLPDTWFAYQLHRTDTQQGLVVAFRRPQSPHPTALFRLKGLDPRQYYNFEDADSRKCRQFQGKEIQKNGLEITLQKTRTCCLLFYRAVDSSARKYSRS